jgi:hypothetical protein
MNNTQWRERKCLKQNNKKIYYCLYILGPIDGAGNEKKGESLKAFLIDFILNTTIGFH